MSDRELTNETFKKARELWSELGDIPVDSEDCIEVAFEHFEAGTEVTEIWAWFEEKFNLSVAKELMHL